MNVGTKNRIERYAPKRYSRKVMSAGGHQGVQVGRDGVTIIEFMPIHANETDGYRYHVELDAPTLYRALMRIRMSDLTERLTPEEWAQWAKLTKKALKCE